MGSNSNMIETAVRIHFLCFFKLRCRIQKRGKPSMWLVFIKGLKMGSDIPLVILFINNFTIKNSHCNFGVKNLIFVNRH